MDKHGSKRTLKTIETAVEVIDVIYERDGARVSEVADELELAHSTVHGYLSTLKDNRYLVKKGAEYRIGLKLLNIGGYASHREEGYTFASQKVKELAAETGERAQFIVEEHGRGIYIHTETGNEAVQIDARIGKENYLHASSAGKVILANLPKSRVEQILDRWGLPQLTENTITSRGDLFKELEQIKDRGVAFNKEESVNGLRAVGVPVMTPQGTVLGALSVSGPSNRLQDKLFHQELPKLLLGIVNEIELKISYS